MPTYEYECSKCGYRFEETASIKAEPRKRCPKCRGKVQRLISSNVQVLFKGNGFYVTDYRSEEYKRKAKEEKKAASGKGGDGAAKDSTKKSKETS